MPVYNRFAQLNNQINPQILRLHGPLLSVEISIPAALADLYNQMKQPIPQPKTGFAMLDTGAFRTCVDNTTIQGLGVRPVGLEPMLTPSGRKNQNTYPDHFRFPGTSIDLEFSAALGADLTEQTFNGQPIIALVGRDILAESVFIYNGLAGMFTLTH